MLACKDIHELATDYQEHALPWGKRLQFRLHLLLCDACRALLAQLERTRTLLGRLGGGELTKAEEDEILSVLRGPAPRP